MTSRPAPAGRFVPRIVNPVKMRRAFLFAADAQVRGSKKALDEAMPWLKTEVLTDLGAARTAAPDEPSVFLFDDTGLALSGGRRIRSGNRNAIIVLLSFQPFIQCAPPQAARRKYPYASRADLVFAVDRREFPPDGIVLPAVRAAEDLLNVRRRSGLRRFIFHVVDDEPRWLSQFLPILYGVIGQRAAVMISRTYEESLGFLFGVDKESAIGGRARGHGDDVVCLIADLFFPKGRNLQSDAGRRLVRLVNKHFPRIPVIVASKAKEAAELRGLGLILPKGDPGSAEKLKEYVLDHTGMGDFVIFDERGRELRRARNIQGIHRILVEAGAETAEALRLSRALESYGERDKFSTWLYMHSYPELGDRLRPRRLRGRGLIAFLERTLRDEIAGLDRIPLLIGGKRVDDLPSLLEAVRSAAPGEIQPYSDNDVLSSWLDRRGFSELAEELRPIHGSGPGLRRVLTEILARWSAAYERRGPAS